MHPAFVIAGKDLRQKVRDRSAILLSVVAPFVLAAMFATMLPRDEGDYHTSWAIVDEDGGPIAAALLAGPLAALDEQDVVDLVRLTDPAEARAQVDRGMVGAAIVIPAGFSDAVTAGSAAALAVTVSPDSPLSGQVARSVLAGFASRLEATQLAVATTLATTGVDPDPALLARIVAATDAEPEPVAWVTTDTADRKADTATYFAASMAVLFVFFAAQFGVMGLLAEKRNGTLARMLASPIAARSVLLGKVLVSITLAVVSMSVIVVGTTALLGARWGDPLAVAALIVATALSASGIALLVVGFARNEDQAGGLIAIVAMTLAILGGAFFPMSQAPEGMARLSLLTPQAWFLRGINDLAGGDGIGVVLQPVIVLVSIGLVTGALGLARARRVVTG
jgi:ABC-2 type transport system permease protein